MEEKPEERGSGYHTLILVWAGLIALTGATVAVARMRAGGISIVSPLIIASVKAGLVASFFMRLKYEGGLFKVFLAIALGVVFVLSWLVYSDVAYRG